MQPLCHPSSITATLLLRRAREVTAIGLTAEAQLLAEAGLRLQHLLETKATGHRCAQPPAAQDIALPRRLRGHGGSERALMVRAALEIDSIQDDLLALPAAVAPQATLSARMRAYLLDAIHPGGAAGFEALVQRGLIQAPHWGAPLTEAGLAYIWGHSERRLDAMLTSKQRRSLVIIQDSSQLACLMGGTSPLRLLERRDRVELVDPKLGNRMIGLLHPFYLWKTRMGMDISLPTSHVASPLSTAAPAFAA